MDYTELTIKDHDKLDIYRIALTPNQYQSLLNYLIKKYKGDDING